MSVNRTVAGARSPPSAGRDPVTNSWISAATSAAFGPAKNGCVSPANSTKGHTRCARPGPAPHRRRPRDRPSGSRPGWVDRVAFARDLVGDHQAAVPRVPRLWPCDHNPSPPSVTPMEVFSVGALTAHPRPGARTSATGRCSDGPRAPLRQGSRGRCEPLRDQPHGQDDLLRRDREHEGHVRRDGMMTEEGQQAGQQREDDRQDPPPR